MKSTPGDDRPIVSFSSQKEWSEWLDEHHAKSSGVWLMLAKKGSDRASVTYAEALEVALCYGWIDGQKKSHDTESWLQKFTPRSPRSIWSQVNKGKAEDLIRSGRMRPAGLRAVENARRNGQWDAAYEAASTATVPDDFQAMLDASPKAKKFFDTLDRTNRYAILWRIRTAKKAETRERRMRQFIEMLEKSEKLHP
jgi:uncharacterized protein YdeI (YjbR/CyaY-like superfamily)